MKKSRSANQMLLTAGKLRVLFFHQLDTLNFLMKHGTVKSVLLIFIFSFALNLTDNVDGFSQPILDVDTTTNHSQPIALDLNLSSSTQIEENENEDSDEFLKDDDFLTPLLIGKSFIVHYLDNPDCYSFLFHPTHLRPPTLS